MKIPSTTLVLTLLGLSSLWGCSSEEAASNEWAPEVPAGRIGLQNSGDFSFEESDISWTVFVNEPADFEWKLQSNGGEMGVNIECSPEEGPVIYRIRLTHSEVSGARLLEDPDFFGGEEEMNRLLEADPGLESHEAFEYTFKVEKIERGQSSTISLFDKDDEVSATVDYAGLIPGSLKGPDAESLLNLTFNSWAPDLDLYFVGSPISLVACVEQSDSSVEAWGGGGGNEDGTSMIAFTDESGAEQKVPISEYEGRAWEMHITFSEPE